MDINQEVFDGKKLSDLIKEAYEKHKNKDTIINEKIIDILGMIESAGEALALIPVVKPLIDSGLKNDEVLLKIVQIFQKSAEAAASSGDGIISQKDIDQLFNDIVPYNSSKSDSPKELPTIKE